MNSKIYYSIAVIITVMLALGSAAYSIIPAQGDTQMGNYRPAFLAENILPENPDQDESPAVKNKTVYVLLDHHGAALDQRIVNRIYGQEIPGAGSVFDYGVYTSVENMITGDEPIIDDNRIIWDSKLLNNEDIYYEGTIKKQLPVDITVTYYRSYADNEHNRSSEVRFIIQTPRIEIEDIVSPDDLENNQDSSGRWAEQLMEKLVKLFE